MFHRKVKKLLVVMMVVLFSATTVAFWTHTGVAIRKSQHHDGLRTLLSCITEPKTERDRMRSNLWQTSKFFLAVSSSTLFKPKATIGVDMNKMVGYKAAESAFAPDRLLYSPPLLPQSALLNSIPIPENELVAELQAELESFVQLINPSSRQALQIKSNTSVLWNNLRTNAQRLAGMFLYNRKELTPVATPYDTTDAQQLRKVLVNKNINQMQLDVLRLVNASQRSSVSESLRFMRRSLNELCNIANLLVPFNETEATAAFAACVADQKFRDDDERSSGTILRPSRPPGFVNIPRLLGRATVILTFQRPGPDRIVPLSPSAVKGKADDDVVEGRVTLVVDGTNYPLTGGAFVDLCLKGYYDNLPVRSVPFEFDGEAVPRTVFGSEKFSYTDPLTGRPRRLPLEVLRDARTVAVKAAAAARAAAAAAASNNNSTSVSSAVSSLSSSSQTIQENYGSVARFTATGLARNSAVFTRAQPVLSFATYGSIGMMHSIGDGVGDGASSSFFWCPPDRTRSVTERDASPAIQRMNNRYSLFAHVIEGNDILELLKPGDILLSAEVKEEEGSGVWKLLRASDILGSLDSEVLIPGEDEDE